MKNLFIIALLVVSFTTFAQETKDTNKPENSRNEKRERLSPEERDAKHLKKLTADLNLNQKQQEQVGKMIAEQGAKRDAFRAGKKVEHEAMKGKMEEERAAMDAKMKAILTPEQMTKWNTNNEKRRAEMKERMHERRGN